MKVTIIDYGMGNLWSVANALSFLGAESQIESEPNRVAKADALILPGVGSFRLAMQALCQRGLNQAIEEAVRGQQRKILGVCLGMQMLAQASSEDGASDGLGLIPGLIDRFSANELGGQKLPHIGFNRVRPPKGGRLFEGLPSQPYFYFVHSYRLMSEALPGHAAMCNYGVDFVAAYEHENVFAAQFHPEKSQTNGLRLLANFLSA